MWDREKRKGTGKKGFGLDKGGSGGNGVKWLDSKCSLKGEQTEEFIFKKNFT